ncbi:hypothetical protein JS61_08005 (plasmid) [Rickettsia felis]|uniref:hypothetical protein n=1 Tax=Rickettsia felis TaxID=42862 RepID=UPI000574B004|nr:hypothetical protein [Rickettsia felis]KHO02158.1 hypothetical protein JS61_08005 [Rickettsia felis]
MTKVRFNECLNKETRFFNISIGVIIGSGVTGVTVWALKNLLFGVAASVAGAVVGSFLMKEYMGGNIQKNLYWKWLGSSVLLGGHIPSSYQRRIF